MLSRIQVILLLMVSPAPGIRLGISGSAQEAFVEYIQFYDTVCITPILQVRKWRLK